MSVTRARVVPLVRMADGTIKQVNPLTGTQVWTVPGRGRRPLPSSSSSARPIDHAADGRHCALCEREYLQTPPERARLVRMATDRRAGDPPGGPHPGPLADVPGPQADVAWRTLVGLPAEELFATTAQFRRIPNLFEILSFDYWHANHGFAPGAQAAEHMARYLGTPAGREHALALTRTRLLAGGMTPDQWQAMDAQGQLNQARAFFAGGHELVVGRRHFTDGATTTDQLAGSGTLTPEEHFRFIAFTVDALEAVYRGNPHARYVAVYQNWLSPAGASFDHLHKQLVAIDERGSQVEAELARLRENPNLYNEVAVDHALAQGLLVAENDHALALAGVGHRYPTLEVYSRSSASQPWEHSPTELRAVSDLLHACHAATGAGLACNEEWHHRPIDVTLPMPWRIALKWRTSTLAGFEGGTGIYLNTIGPWDLHDLVVPRLLDLRASGAIADMRVGPQCRCQPNSLRYLSPPSATPRAKVLPAAPSSPSQG